MGGGLESGEFDGQPFGRSFADRGLTALTGLFVFAVGFVQVPLPIFGLPVRLSEAAFVPAVAAALIAGVKLRWHPALFWITVYLVLGSAAAGFSSDPVRSYRHVFGEIYLATACLFVYAAAMRSGLRPLVLTWLFAAACSVCLGLLTLMLFYVSPASRWLEPLTYHQGSVPIDGVPRITAAFVSASMFFNYLSVGIPLAWLARSRGWISRRLYLTLLIGITAAAAFTFSIGLGGLLIIAAAGVLVRKRGRTTTVVAATLALLAAAWLGAAFFTPRPYPEAASRVSLPVVGEIFPSARSMVWSEALDTIAAHPLLGVGPGMPVVRVLFTNPDGTRSLLTDAHNTFLNVSAERGLGGGLVLLIFCAEIVRRGLRSRHRGGGHTALALAWSVGFIYQGMLGSFEDALHLWVLLGMVLAGEERVGPAGDVE
ncbi:MAG: O-antigen ligase family protein [Pyrinomonadaceae bacterium]